MESILISLRKLLIADPEDDAFDTDLIIHINSAFVVLRQLGVGPSEGFLIEDDSATWIDFVQDNTKLEAIKTYIYFKVKLMFDPPSSSAAIESINRQINELEWRLNVTGETDL